jgi:hypothetical protein
MQKSWPRYERDRVLRKKRDMSIAMVGDTGSGKTYSSIMAAIVFEGITEVPEMVKFVQERVLFEPKEIFAAIQKNWPVNTQFVLEEVGISMDSQNWQNRINKALKYIFQTIRARRWGFIYTTPRLDFLQKSNKALIHVIAEPIYIDYEQEKCYVRMVFQRRPWWSNKTYSSRLGVIKDGNHQFIDLWGLPKLPQEVIDSYEAKKAAFLKRLYERIDDDFGKEVATIENEIATHHCLNPKCPTPYWKARSANPKRCPTCTSHRIEKVQPVTPPGVILQQATPPPPT